MSGWFRCRVSKTSRISLKMKWVSVAGNHDVSIGVAKTAPEGATRDELMTHFWPLWYVFGQSWFIVLYSDEGTRSRIRIRLSVGELQNMSEEQLAFLDKALKDRRGDHVLCFLAPSTLVGAGNGQQLARFMETRRSGNVSAVFAGPHPP